MNNRIQFEKPDLKELKKRYTVVDMHFHSKYSDGRDTIDRIVEKVKKLGIGIAITDHNEIKGAIEIDGHKEILSIPGIEITTKEGSHLLLYFYDIQSLIKFYDQNVKPYMGNGVMSSISLTMEEVIHRSKKFNAITVFPHPYSAVYTGVCNPQFSHADLNKLFHLIDGIEVINSNNINKWNLKSALLGFNLDKGIVGGSDGHTLNHLGGSVGYAKCKKTRKAFLNSILRKQTKVVGKEIDIFKKFTSNSLKLKTNLSHYPDLIEKNIKYGRFVLNFKSKKIKDNVKRKINGNKIRQVLKGY